MSFWKEILSEGGMSSKKFLGIVGFVVLSFIIMYLAFREIDLKGNTKDAFNMYQIGVFGLAGISAIAEGIKAKINK